MAILFDILIVLILAFFVWRGAKKGLILSLCSLLGIFVAFFGARFVSTQFHAPVSNILEPPIYQSILDLKDEEYEKSAVDIMDTYSLEELLDSIKESGLFAGVVGYLEDAVNDSTVQDEEGHSSARIVAGYLAELIAKAALFAVTFLVILFVWFLVGHLLDLAFRLPGLNILNLVGGIVLGLAKAVLLVVVLVWIAQLANLISTPPDSPIASLFTPTKIIALLNGLIT